ncbi:MAG: flippase-like domain-containing protein [Lentimicrobium sp.]|nr:flippase-like domain-containing protein [Lentimicrobium sp.]
MKINAKLRKSINILARIVIVSVALWFIYQQVFAGNSFQGFIEKMKDSLQNPVFIWLTALTLVLMPINWVLESLKWRSLIAYIEKIRLIDAFKSVLTGITMSLFTPNRVGEFFGRAFTLKNSDPLKGALLTITGSISQLLVTLIAGFIALSFYIPLYFSPKENWHFWLYIGLVLMMAFMTVVMVLGFIKTPLINTQMEKLIKPKWKQIRYYLDIIDQLKRETLVSVFILSSLRYIIFSFQFYLLIRAVGLSIPYPYALLLIAMTYFVMAAIPTVALADLGIRGSVSIYFLGSYFGEGQNFSAEILIASTLIWLINLAFPAILGMLFINRLKFVRKFNTFNNEP